MREVYQIPALFLTALCHAIVVYNMAQHKYSMKKFMIYACIYAVSFIGVMGYGYALGGIAAVFLYMVIAVILFFFSSVVSQDCFPKKCFLFITYFCLFSVLDNILKLTIKMLLPELSVQVGYYAAIFLRSVILLLLLALYKKYAVVFLYSLADSSAGWWNLALIAFLFYLLQAIVSILNVFNVLPNIPLLLLFAAVSFIMCAVYSVVFSNLIYMKKDAEAALVRQNAEYLSNRLSVLQNAEITNRRFRHDMRHHLEVIAEYAKAGDVSAILAYIGEYRIEISEAAVKQYSANRTINSILSVYAGKAEESGICFSVRCQVPGELNMRDIDLIALLGNLLENALHGCQESGKDKPLIIMNIRLKNDMLVLVCKNTCSDALKLSGSLPEQKSIGISSILAVCKKYDGNLNYRIENEICSARAILNLQ